MIGAVRFDALFDKFDYSYTLDGSRASETRTNAAGTTTIEWTYDGLNRLISEEFSGFDGQGDPLAYTDTYSFDLASNRTKLVHDDQTSGGGGSAGPVRRNAGSPRGAGRRQRIASPGRTSDCVWG